ncbi:2,3-bisphosphoglycerate-independent phosphoglycerate mutase [Mucisphaera calidilacus]|uniref:2,3-bisphosphoglycerate-independent phosphoglycerate mutase n=1 Tax=Mucisphaera calidilacus TaxID=2527982 RepID=A0A518BYE0_9BACT|nr:2,3-bisphosphoglycerate-independent phosphoglycerate mutase [Mucisphaera calidilacus]QDU71982.1 2,3-bisphosphoglycerate-independent phosphoglycerate mutase [Mucisphaera calidilacus]
MSDSPKPVVVIVRDGWGRNPNPEHDAFNAVKLANTPRCDALLERYPSTLIHTSSEDVGLPEGTMGNSEVGHQNIGAGRVVDQESVRITKAIRDESFFANEALAGAVERAKTGRRYVHLMGIASDAGVHGLMTHLYACLELCKRMGHERVALHLFTDGRDTGPFTGKGYVEAIEAKCREIGVGQVASICGRYYAMDRDNRWERVAKAYSCLTGIHGRKNELPIAATAAEAIQNYYDSPTNDSQKGDEFIVPTMIGDSIDDALGTRISIEDSVIFYNYRGDRPREIVKAFTMSDEEWASVPPSPDTGANGFNRVRRLGVEMVTLTAYEEGLSVKVAYPKPPKMEDIGGAYLSRMGKTQFRCAETEKFPHVTFFCNDYREEPFEGESREMAQSPKVATYDLQPEMSAPRIKEIVLGRVAADDCEDFILVNFANGDMVGHTGSLEAAIKAVETVDGCVGEIVEAVVARGGKLIVTADHGNAEQMFDPNTNAPHTAHTLFDVECIVVDPSLDASVQLREGGRLADVMPTALALMGMEQPAAMTGVSLLEA